MRIDFLILQKWQDNILEFLPLVLQLNESSVTFAALRQNMKDSTLESICWIKYNL